MVKNYSKFCLARPLSSERSCYSHNALLRIWQAGTHFWKFDSNEYQCHASHSRFLLKSDQKCKIWLRDIQHLEFQHVDFRHYWTFNIWTFNIIRLSTFLEFSNFRILKLMKNSSYNHSSILHHFMSIKVLFFFFNLNCCARQSIFMFLTQAFVFVRMQCLMMLFIKSMIYTFYAG